MFTVVEAISKDNGPVCPLAGASVLALSAPKAVVLERSAPFSFALWSNDRFTPDPFTPETTLNFEVPETAQVRLAIYDVLGREVRVLHGGVLAAGNHEVVFDASGLLSGTYEVRLVTPAGSFVGRMQVVK